MLWGVICCPVNTHLWTSLKAVETSQYWHSHSQKQSNQQLNHFRTIGRYRGPAHYDVSIRQADIAAIVTSNFKIFLTQTFPRCGATCYILPWRAMSQRFNGVNFVYRSVEVYRTFWSYLRLLVRIRYFYNGELHWRFGVLCFRPFIR